MHTLTGNDAAALILSVRQHQDGGGGVVGVREGEHRAAVADERDLAAQQLAGEAAVGAEAGAGTVQVAEPQHQPA